MAMALTAGLVARCERPEPDPGPQPGTVAFTNEDYAAAARALLRRHDGSPLWIFAYGSLLWKPAFDAIEHRPATAHGWHRAFCLRLTRWRGSPRQPGLMMRLRRGGQCDGIAYRLPDGDHAGQIGRLLRREIGSTRGMSGVRWIPVRTAFGTCRALTFWANLTGVDYVVNHSLEEVAYVLARARGHIGSGAGYLYHTVTKMEELGIRDRNLWKLQRLVAAEIERMAAPDP